MAQSFSLKKYLPKIHAHPLISDLATTHDSQILLDIGEDTPRKVAIGLMEDSIKSLDTEARIGFLKDLSFISSITNKQSASLGRKLFRETVGKEFEPEIECTSDEDVMLYLYLKHEDLIQKLAFLAPFYASKSYLSYEAKAVEKIETETKLTELSREFTRIANKEDNATEQHMEHLFLDNILYISSTFHEGYDVGQSLNEEGTDRKHITRRMQFVRIAYLPQENVVLISGNVSKHQKLIFLDTFLRVVTGGGYEGKSESYDLSPLKNLSHDFVPYNKGTPFIRANIKSITVSYADGKKKLRIALPSGRQYAGMQSLEETLEELGLIDKFQTFVISSIAFGFTFQNKDKQDKSVNVSCSLTPSKATLCPLFEYERYTKSILKNAGVYEGFKIKEEA
jgi:hypothetical protein